MNFYPLSPAQDAEKVYNYLQPGKKNVNHYE